jgi:co-chaperonin GroES (HSP10)
MKVIRPLNNNVYIQLLDEENKTESGLYLGQKNSDLETGIVVSISRSESLKVGDKIIFNKRSVSKVDDSFSIIKEDNILGIVE